MVPRLGPGAAYGQEQPPAKVAQLLPKAALAAGRGLGVPPGARGRAWQGPAALAPCTGSGGSACVSAWPSRAGGPLAILRLSVSPGAGQGRRAEPSQRMSIFCIKYFDN